MIKVAQRHKIIHTSLVSETIDIIAIAILKLQFFSLKLK